MDQDNRPTFCVIEVLVQWGMNDNAGSLKGVQRLPHEADEILPIGWLICSPPPLPFLEGAKNMAGYKRSFPKASKSRPRSKKMQMLLLRNMNEIKCQNIAFATRTTADTSAR